MKIAVATDEITPLTTFVVEELRRADHELRLFGPLAGKEGEWAEVSAELAEDVASGRSDQGILFCWTGTGSSIAANKVPGVRAALCADAETAEGARKWNHANLLVMSLRTTTEAQAKEILAAWFTTPPGDEEFDLRNVRRVGEIERKYCREGLPRHRSHMKLRKPK